MNDMTFLMNKYIWSGVYLYFHNIDMNNTQLFKIYPIEIKLSTNQSTCIELILDLFGKKNQIIIKLIIQLHQD